MMRIFIVLFMVGLMALVPQNVRADSEGIVAVVNDGAITMSDMQGRLDLIIASSGLPDTPKTRSDLAPQILRALIEEELEFQEAKRFDIEVTDEDLEREFAAVAGMNQLKPEEFKERLQNSGANIDSFYRQLRARIAWAKVFNTTLRSKVRVTDSDVDSFIARKQAQIGKHEYLLSEILLPVDEPEEEGKIRQLAQHVVADLRSGKAPFAAVAQQISKAPGAAQGGVVGWVQGDQLDEDVLMAVQKMQPKTISNPVRSLAGYHILYLSDSRMITEDSIPSREQIMQNLIVERSERLSRGKLKDLRSSAFIEVRI